MINFPRFTPDHTPPHWLVGVVAAIATCVVVGVVDASITLVA